ncbi:MBL fold metallo-hydrolase [Lachnospiraceae bacterium 62-35]
MRNWRTWALNTILCIMGAAILANAVGIEGRNSSRTKEYKEPGVFWMQRGDMGVIQTIGDILKKQEEDGKAPLEEKILGGASLTLLAGADDRQMLSAVIQTKEGSLIVVDGGNPADADHLTEVLSSKGGHVKAWLITHPHADHIGALNTILAREESRIMIDKVYYSFAPISHYEKDSTEADISLIRNFIYNLESKLPEEKRDGKITKGTEIQVDEVLITVLNRAFQMPTDTINNSSVCYMINVNGVYIDFLGDMGQEGGEKLIKSWDTTQLKCDILQMAHHGQNGVNEQVYQVFRPKICLWPTPQWLWDNDCGYGPGTGKFRTETTKEWMARLGVRKHYCTKDGDQIIE